MDKICIKCHEEKNVSEFSFLKEKNGPDNTCKKCKSLYVKNYNKNNKEKVEKRINLKSKENAKTLHLINNKKCSKCNEVKDIDNFSLDKKTNTYCSRCKKCIAECKHFYAINLQKDLDEAKNKKNQNSIIELITHIESLWEPWMNLGNYGVYINGGEKKWHIDHIIPQSFFKYTSMRNEEFQKCWALKNLRPFEAIANIKKSNKAL